MIDVECSLETQPEHTRIRVTNTGAKNQFVCITILERKDGCWYKAGDVIVNGDELISAITKTQHC